MKQQELFDQKLDNALQKDIVPIICVGNHENPIFECTTYLDGLNLQG